MHDTLPPPPSKPSSASATRPLGVPVLIEPEKPADVFTADWVIAGASNLPVLFPDAPAESSPLPAVPTSVHAIAILPSAVPFPLSREELPEDYNEPDSSLFVFPPAALQEELGTVTALQVGPGTCAGPAGYCEFCCFALG